LSHKTRRWQRWSLIRFINEVGSSAFISFCERSAEGIAATGNDPRQDDYDVWLGTYNIYGNPPYPDSNRSWIAYFRHLGSANYLFLDGHVTPMDWTSSLPYQFPDHTVHTTDGTYLTETSPDPW
jgi:prepilin-type processing-associated H-X9-DG protein